MPRRWDGGASKRNTEALVLWCGGPHFEVDVALGEIAEVDRERKAAGVAETRRLERRHDPAFPVEDPDLGLQNRKEKP